LTRLERILRIHKNQPAPLCWLSKERLGDLIYMYYLTF